MRGATVNSVEVLRDGVVSRGVLLDVARTKGVGLWLIDNANLEDLARPPGSIAGSSC